MDKVEFPGACYYEGDAINHYKYSYKDMQKMTRIITTRAIVQSNKLSIFL